MVCKRWEIKQMNCSKTISDDFEHKIYELYNEYCRQVEIYRRLGHSNPEYRAREPKLKVYKILLDAGVKPVPCWMNLETKKK